MKKPAKKCPNCNTKMSTIHRESVGSVTTPTEKVVWCCPNCKTRVKGTEHEDVITQHWDTELRNQMLDKN